MLINEAQFPIETSWEGELAPPEGVFAYPGTGLPRVSVGKPVWWSDQKVLGDKWVPPAGGKRYRVARFAFSLRPQGRQSVRSAELIIHLYAKDAGPRPIFFDLFPKTLTEEQTGIHTVGINPKFKFLDALEVSGLKAEATIDVKVAAPVITADGVGESTARWIYAARPAHPLIGSQVVFAIVEVLASAEAVRVSLHLSAEVITSFGPVHGLLPKTELEQFSFVLE